MILIDASDAAFLCLAIVLTVSGTPILAAAIYKIKLNRRAQ